MAIQPAKDSTPADWIVNTDRPWYVVATYGPPGLQTYARVALASDDEYPSEIDDFATHVDPDRRRWEAIVALLTNFTSTPDVVHMGIWNGVDIEGVRGALFETNGRDYTLMTGTIEDCLDRGALGRPVSYGQYNIPHIIWPDDHAWVISWDTDEENNYTVAGPGDALDLVLTIDGLHGSIVPYATPEEGWSW